DRAAGRRRRAAGRPGPAWPCARGPVPLGAHGGRDGARLHAGAAGQGLVLDTTHRVFEASGILTSGGPTPNSGGRMALAEVSVPRVARRSLALRWVFPAVSLALDVALINLAFASAYWLRYKYHLGGPVPPSYNVSYQSWAQFEILLSALMPASFVLAG